MKTLNKFLIFRPKATVQFDIKQINRIFYDNTLMYKGSRKHMLSDATEHRVFHIDAFIYIFSNLNLFLNVVNKKTSYLKHRNKYTYHDYCVTKNQFVKHFDILARYDNL